jgi:hypothetical protein
MRVLALLVVLGVSSAGAEVLTMRQVDSTNVHMANQRGAINSREDITITVDLGAKGRLDVVSKGMRGEHNLDVINGTNYNTDEKTTWTTTWNGTWTITKGALALDLALVKDTCSAVREEQGTKTVKTCRAARKNALIRCTSTSVAIEGAKKKAAAWQCGSDDPRDVGESPQTWWLGKDRCIEVHAGRMMAMSFAPCSKP